jgi:DNA-binding NarL/FixJ family response regulator
MPRIAVVDDHGIVRDGIRSMVDRTDDFEFAGEAGTVDEALDLLEREHVDIVLLDYRLGADNGFELCSEIRRRRPETRVLIFTAFGNPELLTLAIRAGASGYILKETSTVRLPDALRITWEHGSYFDPRLAGATLMATVGKPSALSPSQGLSDREATILRLIAEGRSNQEIAGELFLSPHTVKFHVTRLLRRFDVHRRSELARIAADMFLTS